MDEIAVRHYLPPILRMIPSRGSHGHVCPGSDDVDHRGDLNDLRRADKATETLTKEGLAMGGAP
ncbi:MAG: hypothetical protein AAB947_01555, partial [Patescibacteria group bacterium]